jgi:hypothetical protein
MSECDLQFSRAVYEVVEQQGERGVRLGDLREDDTLRSLPHSLSLDDHIQCLLNFEMILRVGATDNRLVTMGHAQRWCMSLQPSLAGSQTGVVPFRPWITINSPDPNAALMRQYRQGVVTYILANPGITMRSLSQHFTGLLHITALSEILQSLEHDGLITLHSSVLGAHGPLDSVLGAHGPLDSVLGAHGPLDSVYCHTNLTSFC